MAEIFDEWPEKYDEWFETPIGKLVREYEGRLLLEMARPGPGEQILDVGCGTGIFTADLLAAGSRVTGLELSFPCCGGLGKRRPAGLSTWSRAICAGSRSPRVFFDKTVSVTAIEFLDEDARDAVAEMFRVTRPGGLVVVASLNSLSPWAARRKAAAKQGHPIFAHARFRSPAEMEDLAPLPASIRTAVHFQKHDEPDRAREIEMDGDARGLDTGAFLAACWEKPAVS